MHALDVATAGLNTLRNWLELCHGCCTAGKAVQWCISVDTHGQLHKFRLNPKAGKCNYTNETHLYVIMGSSKVTPPKAHIHPPLWKLLQAMQHGPQLSHPATPLNLPCCCYCCLSPLSRPPKANIPIPHVSPAALCMLLKPEAHTLNPPVCYYEQLQSYTP